MYSRSMVWQSLQSSTRNFFQLFFRFWSRGLIAGLVVLLLSGICSSGIYAVMKWGLHLSNHALITGSIILAGISGVIALFYLSGASVKSTLDFVQDKKSPWLILLPISTIANILLMMILLIVPIVVGSILLLFPGIYLAYRFTFAQFYIIDGMGAWAALKKSWQTTAAAHNDLIGLVMIILGFIALLVISMIFFPSIIPAVRHPIFQVVSTIVSFVFQMALAYLFIHMTKKSAQ